MLNVSVCVCVGVGITHLNTHLAKSGVKPGQRQT